MKLIWKDITDDWNSEFNYDGLDRCPKVEEFDNGDLSVWIFHNKDGLFATGSNYNEEIEIDSDDGNVKSSIEKWIIEQLEEEN